MPYAFLPDENPPLEVQRSGEKDATIQFVIGYDGDENTPRIIYMEVALFPHDKHDAELMFGFRSYYPNTPEKFAFSCESKDVKKYIPHHEDRAYVLDLILKCVDILLCDCNFPQSIFMQAYHYQLPDKAKTKYTSIQTRLATHGYHLTSTFQEDGLDCWLFEKKY